MANKMKKCPHCNKPILSNLANKVYQLVRKNKYITASKISKKLNISSQSASNYLSSLSDAGVIIKAQRSVTGGGLENFYWNNSK